MTSFQHERRLPPKLLVLSPGDLSPDRFEAWLKNVQRCVDEGLSGVLLREPQLPDGLRMYLAIQLAKLLKSHGGFFALHDSPHLAAAVGADAVHLGFRSLPLEDARAWLNQGIALGQSTHEGDAHQGELSDYAFYGPVFETPSKVGLKEPVGLGELTRRCVASPVPIWGLGGIDASNVSTVLQCGVSGVAVRGAIWNSKRPWRQVCDLRNAMGDFFE